MKDFSWSLKVKFFASFFNFNDPSRQTTANPLLQDDTMASDSVILPNRASMFCRIKQGNLAAGDRVIISPALVLS